MFYNRLLLNHVSYLFVFNRIKKFTFCARWLVDESISGKSCHIWSDLIKDCKIKGLLKHGWLSDVIPCPPRAACLRCRGLWCIRTPPDILDGSSVSWPWPPHTSGVEGHLPSCSFVRRIVWRLSLKPKWNVERQDGCYVKHSVYTLFHYLFIFKLYANITNYTANVHSLWKKSVL